MASCTFMEAVGFIFAVTLPLALWLELAGVKTARGEHIINTFKALLQA
jgi:hypothetical protein